MLKKTSGLISIILIMLLLCTAQAFAADTAAPLAGDITITNNLTGTPDTVTVNNLSANDIVKVYSSATGISPIGVTVASGTSATVYVSQLGTAAGSACVTVTSGSSGESTRTAVNYDAETKSAALLPGNILVKNNISGNLDTITVTNLSEGDIVRVYANSVGISPISAAVSAGTTATLYVNQLGTAAGSVYVSIQGPNELESARTTASYATETTTVLAASAVTVTNNYYTETSGLQDEGTEDTVTVSGIEVGDTITIYKASAGLETWSNPVVVTEANINGGAVTIEISQLGTSAGKIYVTLTKTGKAESKRTAVSYASEPMTTALSASNITVTNNYNAADTVAVSGLTAGTIVNVYASSTGTMAIGSATALDDTVTITLDAGVLSSAGGKIYVTVTSTSANESTKTAVSYAKEVISTAPAAKNITVTNNYNASDTIAVSNLSAGDVIKVSASLKDTATIGSATAEGGAVTITLDAGVLSSTGGKIYVTVTSTSANESTKTAVSYAKEVTSTAPAVKNITITNNYNASDTIAVSNLSAGDVIKVYASSKSTPAIASVTAEGDTATITLDDGVLSSAGGKIYVTVTSTSANESTRTAVSYASEKSAALKASAVTVINNYYTETSGTQDDGTEDRVTVSGVEIGDIINIYKTATGTEMWVSSVTVTDANISGSAVTIEIGQLGTKAGRIYVTITKANKTESTRAVVSYTSEPVTATLSASSIVVMNNYNADGTVTVSNLTAGQTVNVYASVTGTTSIASVTASGDMVTLTIDDGVLSSSSGKIYVAVKDDTKLESTRTVQSYTSEISMAPQTRNILVVNYAGDSYDTVTIVGLTAGDTVMIYDASTGGNVLATETMTGKGTTLTLATNLSDDAGIIYVTVTSAGKAESKRVAVSYQDA